MSTRSTISVGILTLPEEVGATVQVVDTLLSIKCSDDQVYVHQNGSGNEGALEQLRRAGARVSNSSTNLGVAGGRNELTTQPGFMDRDLVVFIDNDMILPRGLLNEFRAAFEGRRTSPMGAIAAPVYSLARTRRHVASLMRHVYGPLGTDAVTFDADEFHRLAPGGARLRPTNGGGHPDPTIGYFSALPYIARLAHSTDRRWARFQQGRGTYDNEPEPGELLECGAVHGGCTGYRAEVIGAVPFSHLFNPYGSEDIELALSLRRRGHPNFIMPRSVVLHGTDARHGTRTSPSQQLAAHVNRGRTRTILASGHLDRGIAGPRSLAPALGEALVSGNLPAARRQLWAALVGGSIATRQIETSAEPDWTAPVPLDLRLLAPNRLGVAPRLPVLDSFTEVVSEPSGLVETFRRDPDEADIELLRMSRALVDESVGVRAALADSAIDLHP